MQTVEETVIRSLDGPDGQLLPFLPYILQDLWELGASPEVIIDRIRKHSENPSKLSVLDLGCGKGAVCVKLASALGCKCLGVDALKEFIDEAQKKAELYGVNTLCRFEVGDIRRKVHELSGFDIIILGAIGPVFGDYEQTLSSLSRCLKKGGLVIIDDGYIEDSSAFTHPLMLKRSDLLKQIDNVDMEIIDEVMIEDPEESKEEHSRELDYIIKRCEELSRKYPDKRPLFQGYIDKQREEYDVIEMKVICSTMVLREKSSQRRG